MTIYELAYFLGGVIVGVFALLFVFIVMGAATKQIGFKEPINLEKQ